MTDDLSRLLYRASDLPGDPPLAPTAEIVQRARTHRRRRRVALTAAVAAAAAVAIAVPTVLLRTTAGPPNPVGTPPPTPYPTSGPSTAAALAHGHWSTLAANPVLSRDGFLAVWTGRQLIVWGGVDRTDQRQRADGAAYDLATDSWQQLPPAPLGARHSAAAVWTGSQLFVWGGEVGDHAWNDGALYDPAARSWTKLPAAPLAGRDGVTALLVGHRVVVLGGRVSSGTGAELTRAAAYDLDSRSWTELPRLAPPADGLTDVRVDTVLGVAAGDRIYTLTGYAGDLPPTTTVEDGTTHTTHTTDARVAVSRYDFAAGAWVQLPRTRLTHYDLPARLVWTGRDVLLPAGPASCTGQGCQGDPPAAAPARLLDVRTGTWQQLATGPFDGTEFPVTWTGGALVRLGTAFNPGSGADPPVGAAWDPTRNRWYDLPRGPDAMLPAALVWAGDRLLALGSTTLTPLRPTTGQLFALRP